MQQGKFTKLKIDEDKPTSIASTAYGANIDCFGFNINYITRKDPGMAVMLMKLYEEARKLKDKSLLSNDDEAFIKASKEMLNYKS